MRIIIKETTISNFTIIQELSQNHIIALGNSVDIRQPISEVVSNFESLSQRKTKLRKLGIYTIVNFKDLYVNLSHKSCLQIARQYINDIGWHDLQYVCFLDIRPRNIFIHIVFNRVTPNNQLIATDCIGATWQQYEILHQACSRIIEQSPHYLSSQKQTLSYV
ncbi:hypothetical protein NIES23_61440 (plasmid) [Trichormus variabilis NIES-23]|uniref:MobA/VirD2-like nuclease domain-containing protein n=1 Tax=Trichormus variabilis NIES-23 TaxID=1973479 RepID=A0A1Z4KWG9_ANAVA|nr:hypothetical protein NIES23_61440 [Trichormus variabilis NIES-23]